MYMKQQQQQPQQKASSVSHSGIGGGSIDGQAGSDSRAGAGHNLLMDDERDPDVIPAQFGRLIKDHWHLN